MGVLVGRVQAVGVQQARAVSSDDALAAEVTLASGVRGPVLAGLMMRGDGGSYNSAVVAEGGRLSAPYHKMHLLAFGEGVPLAGSVPWLRKTFVRGLGLENLPAFVFVQGNGTVVDAAEGWDPAAWRRVAKTIATTTAWLPPTIPVSGDPSPFHGTPAQG